MQQFRDAMSRALFLANRASSAGDVPVGAVVLDPLGNIIGEGWNVREAHRDPTGHAEIMALRQAGERLKRWKLVGCTLVVTLEPCTMCAGAAVAARVDRVVFGAWEPKTGAAGSLRDVLRDSRMGHDIEVIPGVLAQEASAQLSSFFEECRRREVLKDLGPSAVTTGPLDLEGNTRAVTDALRAEAARGSRSWEGQGAGLAESRVLKDGELLAVEWDDNAQARFGKLPKVPALSSGPRYGTLSPEELRALDAARKEASPHEASVLPSGAMRSLAPASPAGRVSDSLPTGAAAVSAASDSAPDVAPASVAAPAPPTQVAPGASVDDDRLATLPPEVRAVIAGIAQRRRR